MNIPATAPAIQATRPTTLLIGSVEIVFEWRSRHQSHLLPLDKYGQLFSAIWYMATVGALIGVIWYFAGMGDELLSLPLQILQS